MISFLWCHRCCYSVDLLTKWTGRMVEGRLVRVVTACLNEFELSCLLWPEVFFVFFQPVAINVRVRMFCFAFFRLFFRMLEYNRQCQL